MSGKSNRYGDESFAEVHDIDSWYDEPLLNLYLTQGIFIFVLYVVLNKDLRKVWTKLLKLSSKSKTSSSGGTITTTLRGKKS